MVFDGQGAQADIVEHDSKRRALLKMKLLE